MNNLSTFKESNNLVSLEFQVANAPWKSRPCGQPFYQDTKLEYTTKSVSEHTHTQTLTVPLLV